MTDNEPAILVCVLATDQTMFRDNLIGECATCKVAIQYRPHAPARVTRMCFRCFLQQADPENDTYLVTRQTLAELEALRRRN